MIEYQYMRQGTFFINSLEQKLLQMKFCLKIYTLFLAETTVPALFLLLPNRPALIFSCNWLKEG